MVLYTKHTLKHSSRMVLLCNMHSETSHPSGNCQMKTLASPELRCQFLADCLNTGTQTGVQAASYALSTTVVTVDALLNYFLILNRPSYNPLGKTLIQILDSRIIRIKEDTWVWEVSNFLIIICKTNIKSHVFRWICQIFCFLFPLLAFMPFTLMSSSNCMHVHAYNCTYTSATIYFKNLSIFKSVFSQKTYVLQMCTWPTFLNSFLNILTFGLSFMP